MSHTRLLALALLGLAGCSTAPAPDDGTPAYMEPTEKGVEGSACAFSSEQWNSSARLLLMDRFDDVGGVQINGVHLGDQESFRAFVRGADAHHAEWAVLELNVALNEAGVFGEHGKLPDAVLTKGEYQGATAAEMLELARDGQLNLDHGLSLFNRGFGGCDASWYVISDTDIDGDGVPAEYDCDDADDRVGLLLWSDGLDTDDGDLEAPPELGDDWAYSGGSSYATDGGQEAQLSTLAEAWTDVVVISELSAQGTEPGCGFDCLDSCGEYEPDDGCYTDYQALALGILSFEVTGTGVATLTNSSADWDVCLEGYAMWDAPGSQSLVVGEEVLAGSTYRIPAGSSLDMYYGSWTTDNGKYSPYLGDPSFWCYQNGTSMASGTPYDSIGAWLPEDVQDLIGGMSGLDLDGDSVADDVDWADGSGVQGQHNIWDYQNTHAMVVVGKRAASTTDGTVQVDLTVQNRGALAGSAILNDSVPNGWSLVSCDTAPDSETVESDGTTTLEWASMSFAGCTDDCSTFDETVITCEIASNLSADQDIVELPAASVAYFDGDDDEISWSMQAAAFDYDVDGDGLILCGETERWRAGVLNRSSLDDDQDEGFHGYRCALAQNAEPDCYDPGHFLQIGAFLDGPEDDINSECEGSCENPTFDELARTDHDGSTDLSDGDVAELRFFAYGDDLLCEAYDESGTLFASAAAEHTDFGDGESGMSTLNMYGDYAWIKVCEAHGTE